MLAVFQLNGILLCVVVTFLSSLMWEEEAIDYVRWGCTFTHTHTGGEIGHWVCGSNGRLQWKDLCVAVAAILGPFSTGAFVSHPRRASSQRDKEAGKRRESEGGQIFFFFQPFYSTLLSFFWLQRQPAGTWMAIMIHVQAILKKACLFCHAHSVGIKTMTQTEMQQSWISVETWFDRAAGHCRLALCLRVSVPQQFILGEEDEFIWTLILFFLGIWIICALNSSNQLIWSSLPAI